MTGETQNPPLEGDGNAKRSSGAPPQTDDVAIGQVLALRVGDLAYGGAGVGRTGGLAVFVDGAVPGDLLEVRILGLRPNHAVAGIERILEPSAERVDPRCPHFGACGGCQWMHIAPKTQLAHKERQVHEALARIGKLKGYRAHPIEPSPALFEYRNRMDFTFEEGPDGLFAGLHRAGDPSVIEPVLGCHLQSSRANALLAWWVAALRAEGRAGPHAAPVHLFVRRLTIRRSGDDGRMLIVLTTREGAFARGRPLSQDAMKAFPEVGGVVRRSVDARGFERGLETLSGEPVLHERIVGLDLGFTAGAFMQVNPEQAGALYRRVLDFASPAGADAALDLYCGVGAITMLLARSAGRALGVESSREAVKCAEANARANGLARCSFVAGDASRLAAREAAMRRGRDIVVFNPPRAGLPKELVETTARLAPSRMIYVSCNPATLARDLSRFAARGYLTTDVAPFDMFPHTFHIETVARLAK